MHALCVVTALVLTAYGSFVARITSWLCRQFCCQGMVLVM